MMGGLNQRSLIESTFAVIATLCFGLFISVLGTVSLKFQIVFAIGLLGLLVICLFPARRILCVCLWIFIQPLSIEKVVYIAEPIWEGLYGESVTINVSDLLIVSLFFILVYERFIQKKPVFIFNKQLKILLLFFFWGLVSYWVHLVYFNSEFIQSGPLAILHSFRNFFFVWIVGSSIQTKSDLVWILITIAFTLIFQSVLVTLSYATGDVFSFAKLINGAAVIQTYIVDGQVVSRASGTLGLPNEQARFHAMFTFLLLGLFAVKNNSFRVIAIFAVLFSIVAVIFTFSRGAWLTISLAVLFASSVFVKRRYLTSSAWLIGALLSLGLIVVIGFFAQPIIDRLTKGDDGATGSRVRMMYLAKDLTAQYPLVGVGPGSYAEAGLHLYPPGKKEAEWVALGDKALTLPLGRIEVVSNYIPGEKLIYFALPVHNKYLLVLSELGFVGLAIWVYFFYVSYQDARHCARQNDVFLRFLGIGGIASVLIIVIYMNLDLFVGEKIMQLMFFPLVLVSCAQRIAQTQLKSFRELP